MPVSQHDPLMLCEMADFFAVTNGLKVSATRLIFSRLSISVLLLLAFLSPKIHSDADDLKQIRLASEEWERATYSDGTGLYWDIFRYVYEPVGIKVNITIVPYEKAIHYVQRGRADAWPASYLNEKAFALYPIWNFDAEVVSAMYNRNNITEFNGVESLTNARVAWIKGYDFDRYLDVPLIKHELDNRQSILRMLKRGRIDFYLDAKIDINLAKEKFYPNDSALVVWDLVKLKLYPAFSNTLKGRALKVIWDERMAEIHKTDKMKALFKQWEFDYPFDDDSLMTQPPTTTK